MLDAALEANRRLSELGERREEALTEPRGRRGEGGGRRYKRACRCPGPLTVTAPGPPRAIGKGLFSSGFIAMLLTERFAAGRSMNSLVTGLARHGAEISPATLAGTCAQAAGLLAPLAAAIAGRNPGSWHFHADQTTWPVFLPGAREGPAEGGARVA